MEYRVMTPLIRGEYFADFLDVFTDENGNIAQLLIMVPFTNTNSAGDKQSAYQYLPRFSKTANFAQEYWALYVPFSSDSNPDTRIQGEVSSISAPIMQGPYNLGINGPAIFHNQVPNITPPLDPDGTEILLLEDLSEPEIA